VATVTVSADYPLEAQALWRHVVRYDALERMMSGPLVRVRCPEGEEQAGDDLVLVFRLFGLVPLGRWSLKVVARDDAGLRLASEERGSFVRRWAHQIALDPLGAGASRLTDTIEIEAGALTSLVAWFAGRDYARRHRLRKRMVE
jgi:hypothetical protein